MHAGSSMRLVIFRSFISLVLLCQNEPTPFYATQIFGAIDKRPCQRILISYSCHRYLLSSDRFLMTWHERLDRF